MSTPANIEVFNVVAAKVLVLLYESFPTPTNVDPLAVGLDILFGENYETDSPQYNHLITGAEATAQFLIDEGFIRVANGPQYLEVRGFQNIVLTSKGFALLQKTPEAVDCTVDRRSYFERLKSATISGAKAVAAESIGAVVSRLLGAG
ncbi:hypothetical protein [Rhodanobacter sp. PCA2]|uniref:hypothetical protein n=1 Tax=Rhodanobacter sp. PCA2 TaxID=2006117 RepID=UPI0015E7B6BF|nr:hypothetical protein [Rhodanobacter sp. PCA2]